MKTCSLFSNFLFLISCTLFAGCASAPPKHQAIPLPDRSKVAPPQSIVMTTTVASDTLEWGVAYDLPVDILWVSSHRVPLHIGAAAGTPGWLKVVAVPADIDTSTHVVIHLTAVAGLAPEGNLSFTLGAASDSLPQPLRRTFSFYVRKQTGAFTRIRFGIEQAACDSTCARITPYGELIFYDLRGTTLACSDSGDLPASRMIGVQGFALSRAGYAFAPSCRVAAVYETSGMLTFVNLGLSGRFAPGAVLLSLRGVSTCWLSPDNTIALVQLADAIMPYEIVTGRMLGGPCHLSSDTVTVRVQGKTLRAGMCKWDLP